MTGTPTVLIVDTDDGLRATLARELRGSGFGTHSAATSEEAMGLVRSQSMDCALITQRWDGEPLRAILQQLRGVHAVLPFILVGGWLSVEDEAQLGALAVIDVPTSVCGACRRVVAAWNEYARRTGRHFSVLPNSGVVVDDVLQPSSNVDRWCRLMLETCQFHCDPRTMQLWAQGVGSSASSVSQLCRTLNIPPHCARDFARMMRANRRARDEGTSGVELFLSASEPTIKHLMSRAGFGDVLHGEPVPANHFLSAQRFIPSKHPAVHSLRQVMRVR